MSRIDLTTEDVFPLSDLPRRYERMTSKRIHISTAYRWTQVGIRGVKLEAIRGAGSLFTSTEAVQRFFDALTAMDVPDVQPDARADAHERAKHICDREGL